MSQETASYSDLEKAVIARLTELQGTQSDRTFTRRWLVSVSETTWFRIKRGEYKRKGNDALLKIANDLARLEDHLIITQQGGGHEILPLLHIRLGIAAVRQAFGQVRNRLVIILAETGGGKTTIAQAIAEEYPGACATAQASEPWRSSYMAALQSIADGCGIGALPPSTRKAESALISYLKQNPRLIVIDEGNYFGPATLNLVKLILNLTQSTVAILALPVFWDGLVRTARQEAQQLRNRTAAILRLTEVDHEGVYLAMLDTLGDPWVAIDKAESKAAIARIVREAKSFGLWNTVFSIADELRIESAGDSISTPLIEKAISNVRALRN